MRKNRREEKKNKSSSKSDLAKSLQRRANRSLVTKDTGSSMNIVKFPANTKFFKPESRKNYAIMILPFQIKSKNNPLVKIGEAEVGEWDYFLDVWVHKNLGPSDTDVVCLKKNYGKRCPACEFAEEFKKNKAEYDKLRAKRRCYYNIIDADDIDGGVMAFNVSHFLFEKELIEEARAVSGDGELINFADPDEGYVIEFRTSSGSFENGNPFVVFKSFDFIQEDIDVGDLLDSVISFDEHLIVYDYEEIVKIIHGADDEDEEENVDEVKEEKTKRGRKARAEKAKKEEENPRRGRKRKSRKESDEEDTIECPKNHVIGKDTDNYDDCDKCEYWDYCDKLYHEEKE